MGKEINLRDERLIMIWNELKEKWSYGIKNRDANYYEMFMINNWLCRWNLFWRKLIKL